MTQARGEEPKFAVEEVDSVPTPPRARVDMDETPAEKLERKRDYLEGFLAEKPEGVTPGAPGGDIYEGVIAALKNADLRERFVALGADPLGSTPPAFAPFIGTEIPKWGKAAKTSGAPLEHR